MKPFNLELAKQGKPVCTRDGRPARIVCFDRRGIKYDKPFPILALVDGEEQEEAIAYHEDGTQCTGETSYNLFMVSEKKSGWINVYKDEVDEEYTRGHIYDSKEDAIKNAIKDVLTDTIQIEYEI